MDLVREVASVFEHGFMFGLESNEEPVELDPSESVGCSIRRVEVAPNKIPKDADLLDLLYGDGDDEFVLDETDQWLERVERDLRV
jgi:hypothetical protein